jgi:hypothetical protein
MTNRTIENRTIAVYKLQVGIEHLTTGIQFSRGVRILRSGTSTTLFWAISEKPFEAEWARERDILTLEAHLDSQFPKPEAPSKARIKQVLGDYGIHP